MRRPLRNTRILLTGASAGIGESLAEQLVKAGSQLLITARRADRLEALAHSLRGAQYECAVLAGDITDPQHRAALRDWVQSHWQGLDVLINNAGVGAVGPFETADEARLRQVMEVNFFAPVELIRGMLPILKQGHAPAIVNISSVLGHRAVPNKGEYCASKFALHGISDALRSEFSAMGIDMILVSPSTTSSEFFDQLIAKEGDDSNLKSRPMTPQQVAKATIRALQRGKHEVILTPSGKALVWLDRLCPPLANYLISRWA